MCGDPGDLKYFSCWDPVLLWTWPGLSLLALAVSVSAQICQQQGGPETGTSGKAPHSLAGDTESNAVKVLASVLHSHWSRSDEALL